MKTFPSKRQSARAGFTLTELMVASTISVLLVLGLVGFYSSHRRSLQSVQQINDLNQRVGFAMDQVATDIHNAGYGAPKTGLGDWVTWVPGITGIVTVVSGAGESPDVLHLLGAFDAPIAELGAASTSNSITLQAGQAINFNTTTRKLIFIGRTEVARIISISGDTLFLSTSATNVAVLRQRHVAGEPVELVKVITYSEGAASAGFPRAKYLKRWDNDAVYDAEWRKMVASNIEGFKVEGESRNKFNVTITGRSPSIDASYTDPVKNDHYRRATLSSATLVRQP